MNEPNWAQLLDVIYRRGESIEVPIPPADLSGDHIFVKHTDLDKDEIEDALDFINDQNLIEQFNYADSDVKNDEEENPDENPRRRIVLNPKGFDVAHDRELADRQHGANVAVAFLTMVLALTAGVQAAAVADTATNSALLSVMVLGILVILGTTFLQLKRAGILDIDELTRRRRRRL